MMKTGDYSIDDLKLLFRKSFAVGEVIETTLRHPNGTYLKLGYEILAFERYGAICLLLYQYGNNENGKDISSIFPSQQTKRFIHADYFKYFYGV